MLFSYFLGLPLSLSLVRPPRTTSSHLASLRLTSPHHPDSLIFQAPRKWVARISSGICRSYRKHNPRSTNEVIPLPPKAPSPLRTQCCSAAVGEISSSANDLWDDYFLGGDVAILHCHQKGPKGEKKAKAACTRTESSVLGILDGASSAVDRDCRDMHGWVIWYLGQI